MASRKFYIGHMVSDLAVNDMISNMQETADQVEFDRLSDEYRQHMIAALEELDDRLWWEPETGSVNYEDDGSEKPLPDADEFETWWEETTSAWAEKRGEMNMKIRAMDTTGKGIVVEIDPNADRHIVVNGEEISSDLSGLKDLSLERKIDNACDNLYDMPIYEDGMIHTGKTKSVYVWQEAKLV